MRAGNPHADWRPMRLAEIACLPYLVIRLGNARWRPGASLLTRFDVSYGVFLYSFPMTQFAIVWLGHAASVPAVTAVAAVLTFPAAFASWVAIERPAFALRDALRGASTRSRTPAAASHTLCQPMLMPRQSGAADG